MLEELAGHELCVPVGTDDQRSLDEVSPAPDGHAGGRSRDSDQHDRERPEDDPLPEVGAGGTGDVRDDEAEPHDRRHEGDDADEVVHGRVLRSLGVAVVEPHRSSQDNPERKAGGEEEGLAVERQSIVRGLSGKHDLQRDERGDERRQVGDEQGAADGAATIPAAPRACGAAPEVIDVAFGLPAVPSPGPSRVRATPPVLDLEGSPHLLLEAG